ncbi:pentapeptide repeat-containing protein [Synechococcus sp. CS-197]|uniref:pentapeptide repeat-containing protein n=1 Tax=Synechococcus sp. CS-197 TaxID=2847985 RepID=UPI000152581D|nr:pentapeptide repeat-containing protein [Synechococcus sp. CS-197]MCT0250284.1 pentapeptide repeat-containing protein [Synechococcus sp. CS-197]PTT98291.1 pentapeptide repeat-containing protein [Pseudomonas sp. HMWF031]CAK22734.1 Secreted protein with pentapeptide repeats [Synechococcus sp. WH 7803]
MANPKAASWVAALLTALLTPSALQAGTPQSVEVVPYGTPQERLLQLGACAGCDLRGLNLQGEHLIGVDLRDADLHGVDLREANLEGADLSGARLDGADLRGARLSNADLTDTDLRRADLRDAVVINAYAPNVRTDGMRFAGADLTGSHLIYGGGPD